MLRRCSGAGVRRSPREICYRHDAIVEAHPVCERARGLVKFQHPERALYIFGPEDGSVSKSILERVPFIVSVPTNRCMNLAATVNVVLYDRMAKQ